MLASTVASPAPTSAIEWFQSSRSTAKNTPAATPTRRSRQLRLPNRRSSISAIKPEDRERVQASEDRRGRGRGGAEADEDARERDRHRAEQRALALPPAHPPHQTDVLADRTIVHHILSSVNDPQDRRRPQQARARVSHWDTEAWAGDVEIRDPVDGTMASRMSADPQLERVYARCQRGAEPELARGHRTVRRRPVRLHLPEPGPLPVAVVLGLVLHRDLVAALRSRALTARAASRCWRRSARTASSATRSSGTGR